MQISWLVDKRVIFVDIGTTLTMVDLIEMNDNIIEFLNTGEPEVHIIYRATEIKSFPMTFSSVGDIFTMVGHKNLGWSVTISNSRILKLIGTMVNKIANRHTIKYVDTYDDAKQLLKKQDPTLPDLPDSL